MPALSYKPLLAAVRTFLGFSPAALADPAASAVRAKRRLHGDFHHIYFTSTPMTMLAPGGSCWGSIRAFRGD